MIWFACKQCGKVHGRPESSVGVLVFCECGQGNSVPWESNAPAPALDVLEAPAVADVAPVAFEPATAPEPAVPVVEARPRRGRAVKRDPDRCFNHQEVPQSAHCADCDEAFCGNCLVTLQGQTLCGPCKNFRARRMELLGQPSGLASASMVLAFLTSPLATCPIWFPGSSLGLVAVAVSLPQLLALGLGIWALYVNEKSGRSGGQAIAITGVATSTLMCLLTMLLYVSATRMT